MPSTYTKRVRSARPRLFRCSGYGDCEMIFTRSEHLARHTRKHTGEKPFKCIVPGCTRTFSRFDNMMQHTSTHKQAEQSNHLPVLTELHITQDEFEALQGFGRFKHQSVFIDSFRDLAHVVFIEPNPIRS